MKCINEMLKITMILVMCCCVFTCVSCNKYIKQETIINESINETVENSNILENNIEDLPIFYVKDKNLLNVKEEFCIEDYYIKEKYTGSNYFIIDDNNVLWGNGSNNYGILGTGTHDENEYYTELTKISENVVLVDSEWNGNFMIFLSEDGILYGLGKDLNGLLTGNSTDKYIDYNNEHNYPIIDTPIVLMTDVKYARAGRTSIVIIKKDGTAWWWGEFKSTFATEQSTLGRCSSILPVKILDNCKYIVAGAINAAAINENGELFTWGSNVFGQCGIEISENDDYVRIPQKVYDNVEMVWINEIRINDKGGVYDYNTMLKYYYDYNIFIELEDGSFMSAGKNLGNKVKVTAISGNLERTEENSYSDEFIPISFSYE